MIAPDVVARLQALCAKHNIPVGNIDQDRPWGGEFIFSSDQVAAFARVFFPDLEPKHYANKLATPKLLIVAPGQRFSWQYHRHRGELWSVVEGPVGIETSMEDAESPVRLLEKGEIIETTVDMRHRLVGQSGWGVVAELWVNADPRRPSKETDNVRVQDDYGRV